LPILALDTATAVSSVAVAEEKKILAEITQEAKLTHSETLLPHIAQALEMANINRNDLEGVAVSIGPGSFTGLRIGLATAKSISYALHIPIIGVPTLAGLAYHFPVPGVLTAAFIDAQKGNAYFALYEWQDDGLREKEAVRVLPLPEAVAYCGSLKRPVMLTGDIIKKRLAKLGSLPDNVCVAQPHDLMPRAANIALLGLRMLAQGETGNVMDMEPVYIRRSEAEVLWEKNHPAAAGPKK
jgi:tRNA threonylcarbamoyladenosine biosynthesis protein TsaB